MDTRIRYNEEENLFELVLHDKLVLYQWQAGSPEWIRFTYSIEPAEVQWEAKGEPLDCWEEAMAEEIIRECREENVGRD